MTGAPGWITEASWMSSSSAAWPVTPFAKAALTQLLLKEPPMTVDSPFPPRSFTI